MVDETAALDDTVEHVEQGGSSEAPPIPRQGQSREDTGPGRGWPATPAAKATPAAGMATASDGPKARSTAGPSGPRGGVRA